MSLDFSGLGDLAAKPIGKRGWEPLRIEDLADGDVLAFDQSLTACGWVYLSKVGGVARVLRAGVVRPEHSDLKRGAEQDLRRGVDVFHEARLLIQWAVVAGARLAHESPPNAQQVKGGGTSSLMAAQAVRCAAAAENVAIEMLGAQPAKKLVCGNSVAPKPEAHAALKRDVLPLIQGSDQITNEATRDALLVGLLHLSRRRA